MAELQRTVSEMSQTFVHYNDQALASGILTRHPDFGEDLRLTMQRFLDLAKRANIDSDVEDAPTSGKKARREAKQGHRPGPPTTASLDLPTRSLPASVPALFAREVQPSEMLGYTVTYEHEADVRAQHSGALSILDQRTFGMDDDRVSGWIDEGMQLHQYRAQVPDASPMPPKQPVVDPMADAALKSTYTYSFQETSFARRLLRAGYERSYRLLTNPNANPAEVQRLLRYSLCHSDQKAIINRIRAVLMRSRTESLDNWDMPMLHIGGAGLHFPRPEGEALPPNWADSFSMGPYRPQRNGPAGAGYPLNLIDFADLQGAWFDTNDVEQYLKTKGLHLDGSSSLAEIEIDESLVPAASTDDFGSIAATATAAESPSDSSHSSNMTEPVSPANSRDLALDPFAAAPGHFFAAMDAGLPATADLPLDAMDAGMGFGFGFDVTAMPAGKTEVGYAGFGQTNAFPEPGFGPTAAAAAEARSRRRQRRRRLLIDVDRLLNSGFSPFLRRPPPVRGCGGGWGRWWPKPADAMQC